MRRRDFLGVLSGAAVVWPAAAWAQQASIPTVGFLSSRSRADVANVDGPFRQGLQEAGYTEGKNVAIEYRWAENRYDRLPGMAADLVQRQVAVIAALASAAPGLAAKAATSTIPIVFQTGSDPVKDGLVASINRPGGNVTGVSRLAVTLGPKRLAQLLELVPKAILIGVLVNPSNPIAEFQQTEIQEPIRSLGRQLTVLRASTDRELDAEFASLKEQRVDALLVANDPFFFSRVEMLVALAARHTVPASYPDRAYPPAGGLISYGASLTDSFRQAGVYVGRVLKGEKPADLPVVQPTKFELVINLKTAKSLGITVPLTLQAAADEVIE
jgi:putative ABC transport system substrate-binding protein